MTDKNSGFEDLIDRMIENPAYDQMGGYQIFLRRFAIPVIMILIALFIYTSLDEYVSSSWNLVITSVITGSSLGPILMREVPCNEKQQEVSKSTEKNKAQFFPVVSWIMITVSQ